MQSLLRKERKAKFNSNYLIFRKKFNLPEKRFPLNTLKEIYND